LCDRIAILDKGRIVALGSMHELRTMQGAGTLEEIFLTLTGTPEERSVASAI
jgi:ABC-2 type transport system ATP-binding protein